MLPGNVRRTLWTHYVKPLYGEDARESRKYWQFREPARSNFT